MTLANPTLTARLLRLGLFLFTAAAILAPFSLANAQQEPLRVQLLWEHQSQFAGFYVAEARRHFEAEGLRVELIPGGPGINPIQELQAGNADVAVAWLSDAWANSTRDNRAVNVAQLLSGGAMTVICRISGGVIVPEDIRGKQIGYWGLGDDEIVKEMLRRLEIPLDSIELVRQRPHGLDLIEGTLPCATAMTYNEYWRIMAAGVPASDLVLVEPERFGLPHIEDGLYALSDRLESDVFRDQLTRFVRALRQGWVEAWAAPTLAVESVMRKNPDLDRDHQRHMLETVLSNLPSDPDDFGRFDLTRYDYAYYSWLRNIDANGEPPHIWTHQIWNQLLQEEGRATPLTEATRHYSSRVLTHPAFNAFVLIGVLIYALSGALEAIKRKYDLWGRLILAFLSGIGGGTLRDLLIGQERIPFYYVQNVAYPLGILLVVIAASLVTSIFEDVQETKTFKKTKTYADLIGFSILATSGAQIALASSLPWYWAPACAALTCAGGGMLRAIVINQEPMTFKGVIYEEVALIGAALFLGGLFVANHFEATPIPVYLSVGLCLFTILGLKILVHEGNIKYPHFSFLHRDKPEQPGDEH
ncbi:ABC transporter substrate-binding protein [Marinimicrobium alkaliphilum]|uniref:ABC transporter substrate-binding protein n=1 Tax=Marinimicrobium alkaliphilum TaxID=2202654 RepID=UPI0018E09E31|nr:ABC transporter substrate-binding protein [Marinimicrobium alkaliphilum]